MRLSRVLASSGGPGRLAIQIALLVLAAGCGSNEPVGLGPLPSAPLPTYGLGNSYQFSDGSGDSVISIVGDLIRWQAKNGTYLTGRDVLLPRLAWAEGRTTGERRFILGPVQMFPLEAGKGIKFSATRSVSQLGHRTPVTVKEDWRCNVAGTANVATQAGDFDTWRVDCTMHESPAVTGNGEIQRSVYYAPAIGYYVRTEEHVGGGALRVAELTSYTTSDPVLADTALRQRSVELQRALEDRLSGSKATWRDATTGAAGQVELLTTRRSERYGWCRDFAERIRWYGRLYSLHGMGCRDPAKTWEIVMLAPGDVAPE